MKTRKKAFRKKHLTLQLLLIYANQGLKINKKSENK